MSNKKLLVCDLEGTIFKGEMHIDGIDYQSTMWQPLALLLGEDVITQEKENARRFESGEYTSYLDWVRASYGLHKKYGLTRIQFEELLHKAEYSEGVCEFFQRLDRTQWVPVLISGGFQNLIRRAQKELNIEHGFGACEYFFADDGYLTHVCMQPSDFDGKLSFLNAILNDFKLSRNKDWVFVGDGKNDLEIAKKAPLAFGIHPHDKLRSVKGLVEIESFMEILPYLNKPLNPKEMDSVSSLPEPKIKNGQTDIYNVELEKRIDELFEENRRLKQKLNNQKGKNEKRSLSNHFPMSAMDYQNTPIHGLDELLREFKVVFLGLKKEYDVYRKLKELPNITVIPSDNENFDTAVISQSDFLFIYSACIGHSAAKRALAAPNAPCYCNLHGRHSDKDAIENAIANVLSRYKHEGAIRGR